MEQVRIRHEGTNVQVIVNGALVFDAPWNAAQDIARELKAASLRAEEIAKADGIIFDNALLFRSGAPFGLSNHPDIIKETVKEAGHNTTLRRHLRGGIQSKGIVGKPDVRKVS